MAFMTDGEVLFVVLWLIYFTDSFLWLNKHAVLFISWWGREWDVQTASANFGTAWGGLSLLNPFPPLGWYYTSEILPLSFSPDFIAAYNSQTIAPGGRPHQTGIVLSYEAITDINVKEAELWINGSLFCKFRSQRLANKILGILQLLIPMSAMERQSLIESFIAGRFDPEALQKEQNLLNMRLSNLRILCNIMFAFLFVAIPVTSILYGVTRLIIPSTIVMFLMVIPIIMEFYNVHKSLHPEFRSARITHSIKMMLCPPVAVRACDIVMENAMDNYDVLALAYALLKGSSRDSFFSEYLRDLKLPLCIDFDDLILLKTCHWQNDTILRLTARYSPGIASIIETAFKTPQQESSDRLSYCPRCLIQLSVKDKNCPDCDSIKLITFDTELELKSEGVQSE